MSNKRARTAGGIGIGIGLVAIGLLIGLLIGLMFKGPGLGGSGSGTPDLTNIKVQTPSEVDLGSDAVPPASSVTTDTSQLNYVTVIVEGDGYRYSPTGDPAQGALIDLQEVVKRVQSAPGTAEGIKVRILLHTTAREGARADLLTQLKQAGILPEAIQEVSGFVQ